MLYAYCRMFRVLLYGKLLLVSKAGLDHMAKFNLALPRSALYRSVSLTPVPCAPVLDWLLDAKQLGSVIGRLTQ